MKVREKRNKIRKEWKKWKRQKKREKEKHEGLFLVGLQEPASVWLGLRKV